MVGAYLIALALLCGFAPRLVGALSADPIVVRALAISLLVGAGSIGWIGARASSGVQLLGPSVVTATLVLPAVALLVWPELMGHPLVTSFPAFLAWAFGLEGVVVLLLARWFGRTP